VAYSLDFSWLGGAIGLIPNGALMTVFLTVMTALFGSALSVLGAAARGSRYRPLRAVVASYVELIRNTPFLAQLFFIYFGLPSLGLRLNPVLSAILAMTINLAAYGIEIVGAGLDAVSTGQREAARALALRPFQVFIKVVLPQALKVIYPALTSQIIIMMLESAVVSQIAVRELTYEADLLQARTFRSFETYLVVTLVYLALSVGLRRFMLAGERRFLAAGST
jgi:polar amino acid transport system permease protein